MPIITRPVSIPSVAPKTVSVPLYKRVTAIDIGSTNSQIAQCYQISNDGGTTWTIALSEQKELLRNNTNVDIPTIIVTENDVPNECLGQIDFEDGYAVTGKDGQEIRFLVGKTADDIFHGYSGVKARVEFKKNFFCSNEELRESNNKEKFDYAVDSMKMLLSFFKEVNDGAQKYFLNQTVEDETIITVPLRATDFERNTMRRLAEEVGFKKVQIRDEASAVLRYALMDSKSQLCKRLQDSTVFQKLSVLIVDVGGSTTDILLVEIKPDGQEGFNVDELGRWPKTGEKNTLGGIDIDKKICEWFKNKNYLLPDLLESSIKLHGYKYFREFKEQSSYALSNNAKVIIDGGNLQRLTFDMKTGARATAYPENGKFDADVYWNEIADEYLPNMCAAIRTVLEDCYVREDDIDCIVVSGGGARMCGVEQLLKGENIPTVYQPLHFVKVQVNPKMYVANRKFSSALCAIGSAWPLPQIKFKNACPCEYFFRLNIYCINGNQTNAWKNKTFDVELLDTSGLQVPDSFEKIEFTFAKKDEPLPIERQYVYNAHNLFLAGNQVFGILLSLWSRTEDGVHFQKGWSTFSSRTLLSDIMNFLRRLFPFPFPRPNHNAVNARFIINTEVTEDFMIKLTPTFDINGHTVDINKYFGQ